MTRKPDDWMPLHIGPYLADTTHLTRDQHGAYFLLLLTYWRRGGPLPADDAQLAAIAKATPSEWRKLRPVMIAFFREEEGHWHQKRADEELAIAKARTDAKAEAGKKGAQARWQTGDGGNGSRMADASASHRQTDAPLPTTSDLEEETPSLRSGGARAKEPDSKPSVRNLEPARRWPADASVPDDWLDDAAASRARHKLPELSADTLRLEAAKFANWASELEGKGAIRRGWKRTFVNWILKSETPRHERTHARGPKDVDGAGDLALAAIRGRAGPSDRDERICGPDDRGAIIDATASNVVALPVPESDGRADRELPENPGRGVPFGELDAPDNQLEIPAFLRRASRVP